MHWIPPEIRQSGAAVVENLEQPGQSIAVTADIVLDIHKDWNYITEFYRTKARCNQWRQPKDRVTKFLKG